MSKASSRSDYYPEEDYEPYTLKVRENNIMRINSRNLNISERASQLGSDYQPRPVKGTLVYYDNQS